MLKDIDGASSDAALGNRRARDPEGAGVPSSDALKESATETARLLAGQDGGRAVELLRRLGLVHGEYGNHRSRAALAPGSVGRRPPKPGWVGIWQPKSVNGRRSFARSSECFDEWALWADVPRIGPRTTRKRVVFLGESVGRGFLYDPQFTPAQALGGMLEVAGLSGGSEVVDLARTSLEADHLIELLEASVALEPDAVVVFAGNNWMEDGRPDGLAEHIAAANTLRRQGVPGLKARLEQKLAALAEQLVGQLVGFSHKTGVPVVFVLPEFNLGDWSCQEPLQAPWMAGSGNRRWLECLAAARNALSAGRLDETEALATEMVDLDRGTAAGGLMLLAECKCRSGRVDEARVLLERMRDAHLWDMTPQSPRSLSAVNRVFREAAARGELRVVDLPEVFRDRLDGGIADRRLFLDYCHLSSEGICVAAAAMAEQLSPLLGGASVSRERFERREIGVDAVVESEAHLAAAIHNAHYGQSYDIVRYHCGQALERSKKIADVMQLYLDMQTRRAPMWMCDATAKLSEASTAALRRYILSYSTTPLPKLFDRILLDAMADALDERGLSGRQLLDALRLAEHGLTPERSVDLLDSGYAPSWFHADWWQWAGPPTANDDANHYFKAHAPVSRFCFVSGADAAVLLALTCRVPGAGDDPECSLVVNGSVVESFRPEQRWATSRIAVARSVLREGVNDVEIRWATTTISSEQGIEEAAADFEAGRAPGLLPVFGEIHTFVVSITEDPTA